MSYNKSVFAPTVYLFLDIKLLLLIFELPYLKLTFIKI